MIRVLRLLARLAVVVVVLGWLFLVLPFFSPQRIVIVEKIIESNVGLPVRIDGDARLKIGPTLRLIVTDASVASPAHTDLNLLAAAQAQLEMQFLNALKKNYEFDRVEFDGLVLNFINFEDGTDTWSTADGTPIDWPWVKDGTAKNAPTSGNQADDKPRLFSQAEIDIHKSSIIVKNHITGFEYLLDVENFAFQRPHDGHAELAAKGSLNGQTLTIDGDFDLNTPFSMNAKIGEINVTVDGKPIPDTDGKGHTARVTSQIDQTGDLLEALGLQRSVEGHGTLSADIDNDGEIVSIDQFSVAFEEDSGRRVKASGSIDNLLKLSGIKTRIDGRLFPEGQEPPNATNLQDIEVTGVSVELEGTIQDLDVKSLSIATNAFDQGFDQIGQVSISQLRRSPEGKLEIKNIGVSAGPRNAPYLEATGSIGDLVKFKEIDIDGHLHIAASTALVALGKDNAKAFGVLNGEFSIKDGGSGAGKSSISVETAETDIWQFKSDATLVQVDGVDGLRAKLDVGVQDPAKFMTAIGLSPKDGVPISLGLDILGEQGFFDNKMTVTAGSTQADVSLKLTIDGAKSFVRGGLSSDHVEISDVRDAVAFSVALGKRMDASLTPKEVQPLVLSDDRVVQPLVLEDERMVQPLVLKNEAEEGQAQQDALDAAREYMSIDAIATRADVEFGIDIKRIVGAKGTSQIKSELIARDGKLTLGPLNIALDGGHFNFDASMDVAKRPGILSVTGSTGGWDIGKILTSMGASVGIQGVLSGRFALSGSNASTKRFMRNMVGDAEFYMGRGRIDTSLLKLAGFGVLPWLFSKDLRRGYAEIVCIDAPLRIDRSKVTTNNFVLETKDVQLVARGSLDMLNDTISVRAEPRPVGRPLARSAVPVEIRGKLSDPQIDAKLRGVRASRSRNAGSMPSDRKPCKPDIDQLQ